MIHIANSDRVVICGATGSGKTVIAKYLLSKLNRVIVIDPKHTFTMDGFKRSKISFPWGKEFRIILRPRLRDDEQMAKLLFECMKKKNVTIYCDELAVIEERYPLTLSIMKEIALTGREKRVALWNATQRPRGVPMIFFTEADVFFIFRLRAKDDRDHVAGFIGDEVKEPIEKFYFWYYRGEEDYPRVMRLDLESQKIYTVQNTNERSVSYA